MQTLQDASTETNNWGPYLLRPNPAAIFRLSTGTAAAVSTALLIPDIFALLPSTPNGLLLLCRAVGLWGYACVLWTSGFLCILHIVRICSAGIKLDSNGITLGKFQKPIPWTSVQAVNVAEREIFSRVFFTPSYQMTIHFEKPNGKRGEKQLASFLYTEEEFYSLFYFISSFATGAKPNSVRAFIFKDIQNPQLKKIADTGKLLRLFLTAVITFGLISFLARKAIVNYSFNMGNKEFREARYDKAIAYFEAASAVDFTFAPAWARLAQSEFRQGDLDSAEEHWKEALKWKPDYVEAKLGLSSIYMLRGRLAEAAELIAKANKLAQYDEASYINRAQIESLTGKTRLAIDRLEKFVKQKEGREQAIGILARCYMHEGEFEKAEKLLSNPALYANPYSRPYCTMIKAELELNKNNTKEAEVLFTSIRKYAYNQPELLNDLARLSLAQDKLESAEKYLNAASKINSFSPWISLTRAELAAKAKQQFEKAGNNLTLQAGHSSDKEHDFDYWFNKAMNFKYKDPCLMAAGAQLLNKNGRHEQAINLARQALELDPGNNLARQIIERANQQGKAQSK